MTFVTWPGGRARLTLAEQRRADAHRRGAETDGGLEVGAHAHRELRQAIARGDLGGQREVRSRRLVRRRDAHQALDRQPELAAATADEGVGLVGPRAGFLRLLAGVDLDIEARTAAGALDL